MRLQYSAFWQQPSPVFFTHRTSLSHLLCVDNPSTNFIMLVVFYESRSSLLPPTLIPSNSAYPSCRFYLIPSLSTSSLKLMFHHQKNLNLHGHFLHFCALIERWQSPPDSACTLAFSNEGCFLSHWEWRWSLLLIASYRPFFLFPSLQQILIDFESSEFVTHYLLAGITH